MTQQSALILGTLHGQVDAMEILREQGHKVFACGHRAEGPGVEAADDFFLVDILDVDAVADIAHDLGVDFVYSVGSDIAMPTVARVSERLGLPTFHSVAVTDVLQRKDLLRQLLAKGGLSPVDYLQAFSPADVTNFTSFPAIVKPTDSQGQRGIEIVDDLDAAKTAVANAVSFSQSGTAVVEEWLDGPEISVHVFVVDSEVVFYLPSDRYVWDGDMIGVAEGHAIPAAALDEGTGAEVRGLIDGFVGVADIVTGPLYFQMKLTTKGPRIIEVASRFDGCHLWRLIRQHMGFDLLGAALAMLGGSDWVGPETTESDTVDELHFLLGRPGEPFDPAAYPLPSPPSLVFYQQQVETGERPRDVNGVVSRLGYYTTRRPA